MSELKEGDSVYMRSGTGPLLVQLRPVPDLDFLAARGGSYGGARVARAGRPAAGRPGGVKVGLRRNGV